MASAVKSPAASSVAEQVAVRQVAENEYISTFNPRRMGNAANIAYGGCTLGVAINAAYQTVQPGYHLYSVQGNYLGPALVDRAVSCSITHIRQTRTFATRLVSLSQKQDDGTSRPCILLIADFQVTEPASIFTYTTPPTHSWPDHKDCPTAREWTDKLVRDGIITPEAAAYQERTFKLNTDYFDGRAPPTAVFSETFYGIAGRNVKLAQDNLSLTERASSTWARTLHPLPTEGLQHGALGFFMDGALSFLPLVHSKMSLADAGACSSLDFSLRVLVDGEAVDLTKWHLKEMKTVAGGEGRTYSESRLWDESGRMVAVMTQQSIMRPKVVKAAL